MKSVGTSRVREILPGLVSQQKGVIMELKFKLEKTTKNTYRYQEQPSNGQPPVINTLYVQKWFLGNPPPDEITVAIEK